MADRERTQAGPKAMRRISYDRANGQLVLDDGTVVNKYRLGGFYAALEVVSDVALVSLRDAAAALVRDTGDDHLTLRWATDSTEVVQAGSPAPELIWLTSNGSGIDIGIGNAIYPHDAFPESSSDVATLIEHSIQPILGGLDVTLTSINVAKFVPGGMRNVDIVLSIAPQRRSVRQAREVGRAIRRHLDEGGGHLLGYPAGVIDVLRYAPALLVGQPESSWLEAKRQPYNLAIDVQKHELAKDVAALANAGGGLIVLGFATRSSSGADVLSSLHPVDTTSLDAMRYRQVIRARVYPPPDELAIEAVGPPRAGIAFITVAPQPPELKPFILREVSTARGIRSTALTIPVRVGAHVEYGTPEAIHSLIVAGRAAFRVSEDHRAN